MDKKRGIIILCVLVAVFIGAFIIIFNHNKYKVTETEFVIDEIDLNTINDLLIGSEPPKILHADKENVIFNSSGIFVYNMKDKALIHSFNISSFMAGVYLDCFVLQDGEELIFTSIEDTGNSAMAYYSYSFVNDTVKELTGKQYTDYLEKRFICESLDYQDELYQKSSGKIANISDDEYVYLTFEDWKVSTIKIVYVNKGKETYFNVFNDI